MSPRTQRLAWLTVGVVAVALYVGGLTTGDDGPKTLDERAYAIKETTLCPICDGQNVLESNAPIATSIRAQIDEQVASGATDGEIRARLAAVFGDDVNSIPPSSGLGALVWVIPVAATLLGAVAVVTSVRRWRAATARRVSAADRKVVEALRRSRPRRERVSELDHYALLEEQRHDLLASLDRLDGELSNGYVDEADHTELTDDLTRRLAGVVRQLEDSVAATEVRAPMATTRRMGAIAGVVVVAVLAGVAVASWSGLRLPGQFGSGDIEQSSRDLLLRADVAFSSGDLEGAEAALVEVFARLPEDPDAHVLQARVHERRADILEALMSLDAALTSDPDHIDALTLKGWILVNVPDDTVQPEGIRLLDQVIAMNPQIFDPFLFRAIAAERIENDPEAAIGFYRSALERDPPAAMVPQIENFIAALE